MSCEKRVDVRPVVIVERRARGALARMRDDAALVQDILGQRPAEHGLHVEDRQHAGEDLAHAIPIAGAVRGHELRVHLGELDRRHRARGAAAQLVRHVPPAGAAEHRKQRRGRAVANLCQPLAARQRLLFHVRDRGHGFQNRHQRVGREARARGGRHVLQHDRHRHARSEVGKERDLRGGVLAVGRRRDHERGRTARLRIAREHRARFGRSARDADDQRQATRELVLHDPDQAYALVGRKLAHFACHARIGRAIRSAGDDVAHELAQRRLVGRAGRVEGGRQDGKDA